MTQRVFNDETLKAWAEVDPQNWKTIVTEILKAFYAAGPKQFAALQDAFAGADLQKVKSAAHSLKSSCGNVGGEQAHFLLEQIEKLSAAGERAQTERHFVELKKTFPSLFQELERFKQETHAAS